MLGYGQNNVGINIMPRSRFTEKQIEDMKQLFWKEGRSAVSIGRSYNTDRTNVLYHVESGRHKAKKYKTYASTEETQRLNLGTSMWRSHPSPIVMKFPPPKTYKDIQKEVLSKKFIRDEKGQIIKILQVPYKKPNLKYAL